MDIKIAKEYPSINEAFERTIKDIGIPTRPVILEHFQDEMRKETPSFMHLGQIIAADVSFSAGLMKIVNSPYFGLRSKMHSVGDALTMLGIDEASRAIAAACLRESFPLTPTLERFWNASAQVVALSGWLAKNKHKLLKI